jgi:hypothetical protein
MLIEQLTGALATMFVTRAFGFGSAKPRPIRFGLFLRPLTFNALLELLQIDQIPHACLHHAVSREYAAFSRGREWSRWALAGSGIIE